MPQLAFIESESAVQMVSDAFGCSDADAVGFLNDQRLAGNLHLMFTAKRPGDDFNPRHIDWRDGEIVISQWYQTSTIPIGYDGHRRKIGGLRRSIPARQEPSGIHF